jgi:hypothetical protein
LPLVPFAPLTPFLPAGPSEFHESFDSPFLHFAFLLTMRAEPLFFFTQA